MGGGGKEDESVTCWWGGEKSKVEREGWRGLLGLEEAAWRAVRGARSASMSKPGKSIALAKMASGCCGGCEWRSGVRRRLVNGLSGIDLR